METRMVLAGFGGQGILFAGKVCAYTGMLSGQHVTWLPSYGPEMRGGTANCSVTISEKEIGSPKVLVPNLLLVMNIQSYDKFIDKVEEGGIAVINSSLINKRSDNDKIHCDDRPATQLANDNDLQGLANIICVGYLLKKSGFTSYENLLDGLKKSIPASKTHLLEANTKALELGYHYAE